MRVALKCAYVGSEFFGYARQPGLRTVEGEVIRSLVLNGVFSDVRSARFRSASRTDKGVSSLGSVVAFDVDESLRLDEEFLDEINGVLEDIWITGWAFVSDDFFPRYAKWRKYLYFLKKSEKLDKKSMLETACEFCGEHDFSNFARVEEGKSPIRRIESISIMEREMEYVFEITAQTFLWNQIRRMVAAILKVEEGKNTREQIRDALVNPSERRDFGVASAQGLILADIFYENVDFNESLDKERISQGIVNRVVSLLEESL